MTAIPTLGSTLTSRESHLFILNCIYNKIVKDSKRVTSLTSIPWASRPCLTLPPAGRTERTAPLIGHIRSPNPSGGWSWTILTSTSTLISFILCRMLFLVRTCRTLTVRIRPSSRMWLTWRGSRLMTCLFLWSIKKVAQLVVGAIRGGGTAGKNSTESIKRIKHTPLRLVEPVDLTIKGRHTRQMQILNRLTLNVHRLEKFLFVNPWNAVVSALRQLDTTVVAKRNLWPFFLPVGRNNSQSFHP